MKIFLLEHLFTTLNSTTRWGENCSLGWKLCGSLSQGWLCGFENAFCEIRKVLETAWASIGEVSNDENRLTNLGKADARWLGIRPTVRGTAMNPVDHPHGGGEGRQAVVEDAIQSMGSHRQGSEICRTKKYSTNISSADAKSGIIPKPSARVVFDIIIHENMPC